MLRHTGTPHLFGFEQPKVTERGSASRVLIMAGLPVRRISVISDSQWGSWSPNTWAIVGAAWIKNPEACSNFSVLIIKFLKSLNFSLFGNDLAYFRFCTLLHTRFLVKFNFKGGWCYGLLDVPLIKHYFAVQPKPVYNYTSKENSSSIKNGTTFLWQLWDNVSKMFPIFFLFSFNKFLLYLYTHTGT